MTSRHNPRGRRKYQEGQHFEHTNLTLIRYVDHPGTATYGEFQCRCGNVKTLQIRYVASAKTKNCSDRSRHLDPRRTDAPTIQQAHRRISGLRGPASEHPCVVCGATGANQWAYRHSAELELVQQTGKDAGQRYSLEPEDYWAMCRSHHARWDRGHAQQAVPGMRSLAYVALAAAVDPGYDD